MKYVWAGHSWINEQRNWTFRITTVFTSTFLSYTSKPETLIKHLSELEKKKKSEALILGLKLYMYNVHAYMHIMQCTICNFGFYSLGRISSANLHIFAFISDEMHVIAIFDQKRVKLHFPGDIKYIADSSRCLVSSAYPFHCSGMLIANPTFSIHYLSLLSLLRYNWPKIELQLYLRSAVCLLFVPLGIYLHCMTRPYKPYIFWKLIIWWWQCPRRRLTKRQIQRQRHTDTDKDEYRVLPWPIVCYI